MGNLRRQGPKRGPFLEEVHFGNESNLKRGGELCILRPDGIVSFLPLVYFCRFPIAKLRPSVSGARGFAGSFGIVKGLDGWSLFAASASSFRIRLTISWEGRKNPPRSCKGGA